MSNRSRTKLVYLLDNGDEAERIGANGLITSERCSIRQGEDMVGENIVRAETTNIARVRPAFLATARAGDFQSSNLQKTEAKLSPHNKLNDLTGREWIKFTKFLVHPPAGTTSRRENPPSRFIP